jgi:hypothetical protein
MISADELAQENAVLQGANRALRKDIVNMSRVSEGEKEAFQREIECLRKYNDQYGQEVEGLKHSNKSLRQRNRDALEMRDECIRERDEYLLERNDADAQYWVERNAKEELLRWKWDLQVERDELRTSVNTLTSTLKSIRGEQEDSVLLEHSDEELKTHSRSECLREHCTIHNRSDHSMRKYPQHWRGDRGIMERICPHGVGHPDPDSPWDKESADWIHGCCGHGCCTARMNPSGKKSLSDPTMWDRNGWELDWYLG